MPVSLESTLDFSKDRGCANAVEISSALFVRALYAHHSPSFERATATNEDQTLSRPTTMMILLRKGKTIVVPVSIVCLSLALACGGTGSSPEVEKTASAMHLEQLADEVWQRRVADSPALRMLEGLPVEELPDLSYAKAEQDVEFARSILARLAEVDYAELSHNEVLTAEVIKWELGMQVEGHKYWWHFSVLTPYSSPLREVNQVFTSYRFNQPDDLVRYLDLLDQYAGFIESLHAVARGQLERGIVTPRPNMQAVVGLVRSISQLPEESFLIVGDSRLARIPQALSQSPPESADRAEPPVAGTETPATGATAEGGAAVPETPAGDFQARVRETIEAEITPVVESFLQFLETDYWRAAPQQVGVWQYPDGKEFYRYLTRLHTTMEVEPEDVFQLGLELIDVIHTQMADIRGSVGFDGSLEDFHEILRTDARFFPTSPEEVGRRLISAADAMYARTDTLFLRGPEAAYGVRRLAPALEAALTYGYYDAPKATDPVGYYNYNGAKLDERSWLNLESVAYHELIPGHHFHVAFQLENEELNDLRNHSMQTAFTEGWGVYASNLGLEAGLFEDPFSLYGHYMLESFLASRLVVDPGMNYMEWPLDRARQFMRSYTVESVTQINSETLRYSTDLPGQGLAYQMGRRKLDELRLKAETALGDRFDVRRFHDAVLSAGSLPMAVLEQHIDWFIRQEQ